MVLVFLCHFGILVRLDRDNKSRDKRRKETINVSNVTFQVPCKKI